MVARDAQRGSGKHCHTVTASGFLRHTARFTAEHAEGAEETEETEEGE
jgi:hypothetical protein